MIKCKFENSHEISLRHVTADTLVIRDGKILLVLRAKPALESGKWALPGGYVDRDETIRGAAAREVHEETGYQVDELQLLTIRDNPDRPHEDRQNITFVYIGTPLQKDGESDHEVDEQKWFPLDNLPDPEQIAFDHYKNIELYKKFLAGEYDLPGSAV